MTRYFFDTDDGTGILRDEDGLECDDLEQARRQALNVLPELVREIVLSETGSMIAVRVRTASRGVFEASLRLEARWL